MSTPSVPIDQAEQHRFLNLLVYYTRKVASKCRDEHALSAAREVVPISRLVQDNLHVLDGEYQDNLLPIITEWFSREFFTWFNPPNCETCQTQLKLRTTKRNQQGLKVENYGCSTEDCQSEFDFVRHTDPAILLITRQGRCGEWADCFMLILRSLDYDTRLILDTTDHVWNEVWSEKQQRWIHVDPCENTIDSPLMYELGWSKKLEYCIACGQYEALDVTARYSSDYSATLLRRKSCKEDWLTKFLDDTTAFLLRDAVPDMKALVLSRRAKDMASLRELTKKKENTGDQSKYLGRQVGSTSWLRERGEFNPIVKKECIISINDKKPECKNEEAFFNIMYNSIEDKYSSSHVNYERRGWSSLVYYSENLQYKYERDWATSYVARYETCPFDSKGFIKWIFDLSRVTQWSRIDIRLDCKIYPETKIEATICGRYELDGKKLSEEKIAINSINSIKKEPLLQDAKIIELTAELSGGDAADETSWQRPQLFRQTRVSSEKCSFFFKIY